MERRPTTKIFVANVNRPLSSLTLDKTAKVFFSRATPELNSKLGVYFTYENFFVADENKIILLLGFVE